MVFSVMEISPAVITPIIKQVGRAAVTRNNYAFITPSGPRALLSHLRAGYLSDIAKRGGGPAASVSM